ncbi:MAG TPA: YkvA family protein [Rugosimonospora sp.]|jgi:uncharacterized membrane protein YkvA (DUF1232 family)
MARLGRKAALTALWSAIRTSHRGGPSLGQRVAALPRLFGATVSGRYDGKWRVFGMVLALLYIVSPVDFVPELIFSVFGLVDDSFVAVWLAGAVLSETERFLVWERRRAQTIPGRVRAH